MDAACPTKDTRMPPLSELRHDNTGAQPDRDIAPLLRIKMDQLTGKRLPFDGKYCHNDPDDSALMKEIDNAQAGAKHAPPRAA